MTLTRKAVVSELKAMDLEHALNYLEAIRSNVNFSVEPLIQQLKKQKENTKKEAERQKQMSQFEREAYAHGFQVIAGVDEAGRGPLAGPVVAAAVILPKDCFIAGLNDSKKLSAKQREALYGVIQQKAIAIGIGSASESYIDDVNILRAAKYAMKEAVLRLSQTPDMVLVDAETIDALEQTQRPIIRGDSLSVSIAAASIIAKVTRDRLMEELCPMYPQYGFSKHKGYGTQDHIQAIKKYGICPIHRLSFTKNFVS